MRKMLGNICEKIFILFGLIWFLDAASIRSEDQFIIEFLDKSCKGCQYNLNKVDMKQTNLKNALCSRNELVRIRNSNRMSSFDSGCLSIDFSNAEEFVIQTKLSIFKDDTLSSSQAGAQIVNSKHEFYLERIRDSDMTLEICLDDYQNKSNIYLKNIELKGNQKCQSSKRSKRESVDEIIVDLLIRRQDLIASLQATEPVTPVTEEPSTSVSSKTDISNDAISLVDTSLSSNPIELLNSTSVGISKSYKDKQPNSNPDISSINSASPLEKLINFRKIIFDLFNSPSNSFLIYLGAITIALFLLIIILIVYIFLRRRKSSKSSLYERFLENHLVLSTTKHVDSKIPKHDDNQTIITKIRTLSDNNLNTFKQESILEAKDIIKEIKNNKIEISGDESNNRSYLDFSFTNNFRNSGLFKKIALLKSKQKTNNQNDIVEDTHL